MKRAKRKRRDPYIEHAADCPTCIAAAQPSGMCDEGARLNVTVAARFKVRGKTWRVEFVYRFPKNDRWGECDYGARAIRILHGMSKAETLRVLTHELLHAHERDWTERRVDITSTTIGRVLQRCGVAA